MTDEFMIDTFKQAINENLELDVLSRNVSNSLKSDFNLKISQENIKILLNYLFSNHKEYVENLFSNTFNILFQLIKNVEPYFIKNFPEYVSNKFGILSLSENYTSIPMWSYYSSEHRGFVLEFDESNDFFKVNNKGRDDARGLNKVLYKKEIPTSQILIEDFNWEKLFFTKGLDWKHENEWRMIKLLKDADKVINENSEEIYLFRFPPDAVKGVIFGYKMDRKLRNPIIVYLNSNPNYKDVKLYEAFINKTHYKIDIREI